MFTAWLSHCEERSPHEPAHVLVAGNAQSPVGERP